jgi:predicted PurR-regulated permease PerM
MELNNENIKRIRGLIVFTTFIIAGVWKYNVVFEILSFLLHIMFPFILGSGIAFILNVPMNYIEQHLFQQADKKKHIYGNKVSRSVSLVIVLLVLFGIITLFLFVLIPQLIHTCTHLSERLQEIDYQKLQDLLNNRLGVNLTIDWDKIRKIVIEFIISGNDSLLDSTVDVAKNIIRGIVTTFIAFVFAIYILLQKEKLRVQIKKILYAFMRQSRVEVLLEIMTLAYHTFSGFLTGQCLEALILGSMFVIGMLLLRLPYALLTGIIIAFTALIPIFGAFVGCFLGAILVFMTDPMKVVVFLILFIVLQQIEGNLIYPHVVGNSVGLPPIWVLVAVTLGGNLMGITGMLIFIPLTSIIYALFREIIYLLLKKKQINPKEML